MKHWIAPALALLLAACGGGDGDSGSSSSPPASTVSPGGFWEGTDPISGLEVQGIILESGELHFIRADGSQYVGTVTTTSSDGISGTFDGYTLYGSTYPDGSTHGTGTSTGTISPRASITGTMQFTTDANTVSTGTGTLTFNSLYFQPVSVANLAGTYTVYQYGTQITISADGTIFGQDANTGCVVNGTIAIVNSNYNAYSVSGTFSNCQGTSAAPLNGVPLSGIAAVTVTTSPYQLMIALTGDIGGSTRAVSYTATEK